MTLVVVGTMLMMMCGMVSLFFGRMRRREWISFLGKGYRFLLGRMRVHRDDERFIDADDWSETRRTTFPLAILGITRIDCRTDSTEPRLGRFIFLGWHSGCRQIEDKRRR